MHKALQRGRNKFEMRLKESSIHATITLCDLSAVILFKLVHSCLYALNLVQ